ncbi:TIGR01440 family protein [Marininema halotolerans]|uniref:UPF0340 protein SAMN05444972_101330 n=1 Tax=Marininema halotolerans TaxID=1155944 RepID=A0A1I6P360_9BACL|nr:TIGR01440 family protein [Marininema halotolerans]SFS34613.1 TIGR01440 family protein [Marininema halotolerans]
MRSGFHHEIRERVIQVTEELLAEIPLGPGQVLVMGVSTSEVVGSRIGTDGNDEVATAILEGANHVQVRHGYHLAFQCCEHLNRALVVERDTASVLGLTEVSAVPVYHAGGAMASRAFRGFTKGMLVESIQADAGIDIGETMIGMHLKPVAVPVRPTLRQIGEARVAMARTRPRLIGGARTIYVLDKED